MRSAKVTANAFSAGFHRMVHRACPVPLGSMPAGDQVQRVSRCVTIHGEEGVHPGVTLDDRLPVRRDDRPVVDVHRHEGNCARVIEEHSEVFSSSWITFTEKALGAWAIGGRRCPTGVMGAYSFGRLQQTSPHPWVGARLPSRSVELGSAVRDGERSGGGSAVRLRDDPSRVGVPAALPRSRIVQSPMPGGAAATTWAVAPAIAAPAVPSALTR